MKIFKIKENLFFFSLFAGILLYIVLIFMINLFRFHYQMNADIASDVILGELIWKKRQILPDSWYCSTEARIIGNSNLAAIFYGITGNMSLAMGLACCMMTLLIVCSIIYFCKAANFHKNHTILMIFLCLMVPCSPNILELLFLFAGYYAEHIVILFITLAIYVKIMRTKNIMWGHLLATLLLSFILGLQGVRGILILYGPMFGVEAIRNIYLFYCGQKRKPCDMALSLWTTFLLAVSFLGTSFPFSVGQKFSRNIRKGFHKLITIVIPDMGNAMGFDSFGLPSRLCLTILLLASFCLLIKILFRMRKKRFIKPPEWAWLTICASPVITALIVAFTTVESTPRYYFMLPFLAAFSVVLLWQQCTLKCKSVPLFIATILSALNISQVYLPIIFSVYPPPIKGGISGSGIFKGKQLPDSLCNI